MGYRRVNSIELDLVVASTACLVQKHPHIVDHGYKIKLTSEENRPERRKKRREGGISGGPYMMIELNEREFILNYGGKHRQRHKDKATTTT